MAVSRKTVLFKEKRNLYLRRESDDFDRPGLPDPVDPVLGLLVVVGVEVEIVEDDRVGRRQVDAQATRPGHGNSRFDDLADLLYLEFREGFEQASQNRLFVKMI